MKRTNAQPPFYRTAEAKMAAWAGAVRKWLILLRQLRQLLGGRSAPPAEASTQSSEAESDIGQFHAADTSEVYERNGDQQAEEPQPGTAAWSSSGGDNTAPESFDSAAQPDEPTSEVPQHADESKIERLSGPAYLPSPDTESEKPREPSLPNRVLVSLPPAAMPEMMPLTSDQPQEPSAPVAAASHEIARTILPVPALQNGSAKAEIAEPAIATGVRPAALDSAPAFAQAAAGSALEVEELERTWPNGSEPFADSALPFIDAEQAIARPSETPRPAGRYRPRLGRSARNDNAAPPERAEGPAEEASLLSLDAEIQLTFSPGGWGISLAVLFRRRAEMPEEIRVRTGAESYELAAIADDLFEPVAASEPGVLLSSGLAAESASPAARWVRTGRDLHVFTARAGVAGFVSVPRVLMGQENALLCTHRLAASVIGVSAGVGSPEPTEVEGPGVPEGWRCFRGILPTVPAPPAGCDDLLISLVPLPQAVIEFAGGLPIDRSAWLSGYPPSIKVLGDLASPGDLTINGQAASCSETGEWTAPGWDSEGRHTVAYKGLTRSYEIGPGLNLWDAWPAYAGNGLAVCGALATDIARRLAFASADGPLFLIGQSPGEIVQASPAPETPTSIGVATPDFEPVWAVPVQASRTRRGARSPELLRGGAHVRSAFSGKSKASVRRWCQVVREARQSADWEQHQPETAELWAQYRNAARAIWRKSR